MSSEFLVTKSHVSSERVLGISRSHAASPFSLQHCQENPIQGGSTARRQEFMGQ